MQELQFSGMKFTEADIKRLLSSPEGKQLLQLLNRDGGSRLRQAADALKTGNAEAAKQILSPVLETNEAAQLLNKFSRD